MSLRVLIVIVLWEIARVEYTTIAITALQESDSLTKTMIGTLDVKEIIEKSQRKKQKQKKNGKMSLGILDFIKCLIMGK